MVSDENDILLNYIKLAYPEVTAIKNLNKSEFLYFCVEYKINDGLNPNFLNYCISLENKFNKIEHRVKCIEEKIEKSQSKVVNKQSSYLSHFKFRFF